MKRLIFAIIIVLISNTVSSQLDSTKLSFGNFILLDYKNEALNDSLNRNIFESKSIGVAPEFEIFLSRYFALGVNLKYAYSENIQKYEVSSFALPDQVREQKIFDKSTKIGIGMFGRFYKKLNKRMFFTIQANVNYSFGYGSYEYCETNHSNWGFDIVDTASFNYISNTISMGLSPGMQFFLNKHLSMGFNVGQIYYDHTKKFDNYYMKEQVQNSGFKYDLNLSDIQLGINIYF